MKCKIPKRGTVIDNYLDGKLSNDETEKFEEHFFNCDICFKEVKFKEELRSLIKDEGEVLFKEFLHKTPASQKNKNIIDKLFEILSPKPVWIPALSLILIVITIAGRTPFMVWRSNKNTIEGMLVLRNNWTITSDDLRPSDEFPLSIFSITHGAPETNPAINKFQKALEWNPTNTDAKRGIAINYYFLGNYDKVDSLLRVIISQDSLDFKSWNMLGILSVYQQDSTTALSAFNKSLQIQPEYKESAYNRAELLQKLHRYVEAKNAWNYYLRLDQRSEWAEVAKKRAAELP